MSLWQLEPELRGTVSLSPTPPREIVRRLERLPARQAEQLATVEEAAAESLEKAASLQAAGAIVSAAPKSKFQSAMSYVGILLVGALLVLAYFKRSEIKSAVKKLIKR